MTAFKNKPNGVWDGRWAAKFFLNGTQHWVKGGPWDTKKEAQAAEQRKRNELERRRSDETCESFADRWLEEWPRPASGTQRTYASALKPFKDHFGSTRLDAIDRLTARSWALTVPRGVSRVVSIMYEDARNIGVVADNPFQRLKLPPTEAKRKVHVPSLDEYRAVLNSCGALEGYGPEFKAMVQFSAWTGVRAGEMFGLKWEDIGVDSIWIRRARKRNGELSEPKNGEERKIAFLPPAQVLDQVPRREGSPFIFHSPRGNPLVQGSHFYAWRIVRAAAGLNEMNWHAWRHFTATRLLEMGMSHFDVSVQLGHKDGGALVMATYGHPSEDAARSRLLAAFKLDDENFGSTEVAEGAEGSA